MLTKNEFGRLVGQLSHWGMRVLDRDEIEALASLTAPSVAPTPNLVPGHVVDDLLMAIDRSQRIEAIKAYRAMTGCGLKESKDAIERFGGMFANQNSIWYKSDVLKVIKDLRDKVGRIHDDFSDGTWVSEVVDCLNDAINVLES